MSKAMTTLWAAALALALGGCDEATAPGAGGQSAVEVGVRGDDSGSASASRSAEGPRMSHGTASGTVEVTARVFVQSRLGEWVEVTRNAARQTVQASGSDGIQVLAQGRIDAGEYRRVRVEFERVQANVRAGVTIGTSLLTGVVTVDGGTDGRIVVEREVAMEAEAGSEAEVEINLNAEQWLRRADTQTRAVAEAEFRSAVSIVAR